MADKIIYIRVPEAIVDIADTTVASGLYQSRTEVMRELIRNGMKNLLYHNRGGFCLDLKQMVDCCHDDVCKFHKTCKIFTKY